MRELSICELELVGGAACHEFVIGTMDYIPGSKYGSYYEIIKVCDGAIVDRSGMIRNPALDHLGVA